MKRVTLLAAVALVLALAPGTAHAATLTFCVGAIPAACPSAPTSFTTLQGAADAAQSNPGRDRIEIKAGDYPATNVYVGSPVDIVGAGQNTSTLVGASNESANVVSLADSSSTISDVGIRLGAGNVSFGLQLVGGKAQRITLDGMTNAPSDAVGITVNGGTLTDSTSTVPNTPGNDAVYVFASSSTPSVLEDLQLSGANALERRSNGTLIANRLSISNSARGIYVTNTQGTTTVTNSLIRVADLGGLGAEGFTVGTGSGQSPVLSLRHVSIIGDSSAGSKGGQAASYNPGQTATANVRDSIISGFTTPLSTGNASTVNVAYSDFAKTGNSGNVVQGAGNTSADPGFANPAGADFGLLSTSPLIDMGDPSSPSATDEPFDLAGNPRLNDGNGDGIVRSDIGAYEYQRPVPTPVVPVVPATPPPPALPAKDTVAPALASVSLTNSTFRVTPQPTAVAAAKKKTSKKAPGGTTLTYKLSESATVRVAVEQRTTGAKIKSKGKTVCATRTRARRRAKKCTRYVTIKTLTRKGNAGKNTLLFTGRIARKALKPGSYRFRITAADSAGNRSDSRSVNFKVVR